jgi:hypothetical protein
MTGLLRHDPCGRHLKQKKKAAHTGGWAGNDLFSHGATPTVSSELENLTSVFGMGTGVSFPLESPAHPHVQTDGKTPGGDEGIRTPDLCRAKAALFQLSYIPIQNGPSWTRTRDLSLIRTAL